MTSDQIIQKILEIRGVVDSEEFFNPKHPQDIKSPFDSSLAIQLINQHINLGSQIAIYGDYDVDGICSTAILWETLYLKYKNIFPHIPHRESEGYGLSIKGIDHCLSKGAKLIITVDNGIVAFEQIEYARKKGCDVIVIDHHESDSQLPNANCILHSTQCCAAGLSWFFSRDFLYAEHRAPCTEHLSLVATATVCDLVPLLGINRSFVKSGLVELNKTKRLGLLALFKEAGLSSNQITTYHLGFIVGPRINAMGRLEHAIDSLRLLCTQSRDQAESLAKLLSETNKLRQDETKNAVDHALGMLDENNLPDLIVVSDTGYHPGVIGLIAGKLTEKYHRPSIAISVGESESKASCRSIAGFHITDHLREYSNLLKAVGGHSMAAGFTVSNEHLPELLSLLSQTKISSDLLVKKQRVDLEISLSTINYSLFTKLKELEPYGLGNPQPVFSTSEVEISNIKPVGKEGKHLKFKVGNIEAVWFNAPNTQPLVHGPNNVSYTIDLNEWNGSKNLQLIIKGVQYS